jgi:Ni,Fe-hydrogenase I large subunit
MSRLIIGPFNRVEGDLEVKLDMKEGRVEEARVVSPLYRGFERILKGKDPQDALVYAPRICGICSVSQSTAAAYALAGLEGVSTPLNGQRASNMILATENIADHLTHFYLFFMPDFTRETYGSEPWYAGIAKRFQAIKGEATQDFLPARAELLHITGILAGKWPHTLAIQPGGTTRSIQANEQARLKSILFTFRRFLERYLFGADLEEISSLSSYEALEAWLAAKGPDHSDFSRFLAISRTLDLAKAGRSCDRFMSYGVYPQGEEQTPLFAQGIVMDEQALPLDSAAIAEDVSHAWMVSDEPRHPSDGQTIPDPGMQDGYSWCKAPRLNGQTMETGALSRQLIDGHPLIRDCVARSGGNVENRVLARLLEVAILVPHMQAWSESLDLGEPFRHHGKGLPDGQSVGLVEAARGSLGHWLSVKNGVIENYQIIAPTTWNFSPRDGQGLPGPLEQALVGAGLREGEVDPVSVQHIVRSYDPCMVCTVH